MENVGYTFTHMNTKTIVGLVIVVALLGGGYYLYTTQGSAQMPVTGTPSGESATSEQPTSGANAKINIDVVCEGALAYMSFTDGASADAFVADCKEGNHPEVIERYKAELGISNDAAI